MQKNKLFQHWRIRYMADICIVPKLKEKEPNFGLSKFHSIYDSWIFLLGNKKKKVPLVRPWVFQIVIV